MNNLVSIITPTFNSEKYIRQTIQSVQNQTYQNWEMIIVDDYSSDTTVKIIEEIAKQEPRITLIKSDKNSGPAISRNKGIEKAKGKYMTFLDADDIWFEDFVQNSIDTIHKKGIHFVFSSYRSEEHTSELQSRPH